MLLSDARITVRKDDMHNLPMIHTKKDEIEGKKKVMKLILKRILKFNPKNPKCIVCNKKFSHAIDNKTKKISKYLYKGNCKHIPENIRISIG